MAQRTPEEKELAQQARAQRSAGRQKRITERRQRSVQAMAAGPDMYARRIIASWLQVPFIHFWYSLLYMTCDYVFGGHIIVKNWQKLLVRAGYVSEGALGVAGVWALVNHVAIIHNLLAGNPFTRQIIDPMNGFMMGSFTLIPDLILASAILMTFSRWGDCKRKEGRGVAVLWALIYSGCTITFFGLTIYTLSTVGSVASSGDITKVIYASGTELQIRVISSFLYGLSEIVYAYTHRGQNSHTIIQPTPAAPQVDVQAIIQEALEKHAQDQKQTLDLFGVEQQRLLGKVQNIEKSVPAINYDDLAKAMLPLLQGQVRTLIEEVQGQSHQATLPEPEPQRQLEARASSQSHQPEPLAQSQSHSKGKPTLTLVPGSKSTALEPEARADGTPEERLQAAYDKLLETDERISGRALAKLAHVNRGTASTWLGESKGQQSEPDPNTIVEADPVVEAVAQGQ